MGVGDFSHKIKSSLATMMDISACVAVYILSFKGNFKKKKNPLQVGLCDFHVPSVGFKSSLFNLSVLLLSSHGGVLRGHPSSVSPSSLD